MRHSICLIFISVGVGLFAQHPARVSGAPSSSGERTSGDTLMVPPDFAFTASYYYWVDAQPGSGVTETADLVLDAPANWIDSVYFPNGQSSTDCSSPFNVMFRIHSPTTPGIYTVNLNDLALEWTPLEVILKVADIPTSIDGTYTDTVLVGNITQVQATASTSMGVEGLACTAQPYYPVPEVVFEYAFHPGVPWISIAPDSLTVPTGMVEYPQMTIGSGVEGLLTTYRYRATSWLYWPQVIQYNVLFLLALEIPTSPALPGLDELMLYPNPVVNTLNLHAKVDRTLRTELVLTDLSGRVVLRSPFTVVPGALHMSLDVSDLPAGCYTCTVLLPQGGSMRAQRIMITH